jgi:hypothetical protein
LLLGAAGTKNQRDLRLLPMAAAEPRRVAIALLHTGHHQKLREPNLSEQVTDF